jgi:hypothetical protein
MADVKCWICKQTFQPGERIIRGRSPRHPADSQRCTGFVARPAAEVPEKIRRESRRDLLRNILADSMCRHSSIANWHEKADLVLSDIDAAGIDAFDGGGDVS